MADSFSVGLPPVHFRIQMGRLAFYDWSVLLVLHSFHSFVSSGLGLSAGGVVYTVICAVLFTLLVVYACAALVVFSWRDVYTSCFTRFLSHMYCNDGSVLSPGSPRCLMTLVVPWLQYLRSARRCAVITLLETRSEDMCCLFWCCPSFVQACFDVDLFRRPASIQLCVLSYVFSPCVQEFVCMCCSSCLDSVLFAPAFLRDYGYDICFNLNVCWSKDGSIVILYMLLLASEWAIIVHVLIWRELWPNFQLFAVLVALASSACAFCFAAVHYASSYAVGSMYEMYYDSVKLNSSRNSSSCNVCMCISPLGNICVRVFVDCATPVSCSTHSSPIEARVSGVETHRLLASLIFVLQAHWFSTLARRLNSSMCQVLGWHTRLPIWHHRHVLVHLFIVRFSDIHVGM